MIIFIILRVFFFFKKKKSGEIRGNGYVLYVACRKSIGCFTLLWLQEDLLNLFHYKQYQESCIDEDTLLYVRLQKY